MAMTALMLYEMSREFRGGDYVWTKSFGKRGRAAQVQGSKWKNPFPMGGTAWAGDLLKVNDATKEAWLLKVFKVSEAVTVSGKEIKLYGSTFSHVPSVGDVIMIAPAETTSTGQSTKITQVSYDNDVFTITVDTALGVVAKDTLLVEATGTAASATAKMLCDVVNSFVIENINCIPVATLNGITLLDVNITPFRHESVIKAKASSIPACLEKYNKASYPETDFEL